MNKKLILALVLSTSMIFSVACKSETTDINQEGQEDVVEIVDEEDSNLDEEDLSEVDEIEEQASSNGASDGKSSAMVMDEFEEVKTKSAFDMLRFIEENIKYTDTIDADTLITTFISKSTEEINSSNNYLFGEDSLKINDTINEKAVFDGTYSIFSQKREQLIENLKDDVIKSNLQEIFERGQGLISAEGSYYAVVDYLDLYNKYGDKVSNTLSDYLEIASIETIEPSTIEEYLAISIDELKERSIRYEKFLISNGKTSYAGEVRLLYMTVIWKIVNPSIYDSQLNNDYTVTKEMMDFYNQTKDLDEYPVLKNASKGTLDFIKSRPNGVIGSLNDSEEILENARKLQEEAANQIDKIYMNR